MIPVFLSTKANASAASALVFESVKALRTAAPPEWRSVLEHAAYPEGEWVQVVLAPAAVWVYALREQKASYGMDALHRRHEALRMAGFRLERLCRAHKIKTLKTSTEVGVDAHLALMEGLCLASYRFDRYRKKPKEGWPAPLRIHAENLPQNRLQELVEVTKAVFTARDWVNEPQSALGAVELAQAFQRSGRQYGFKVTVWNEARIRKEGMGGLLAVNQGSVRPPTFTVMEYKHRNAPVGSPVVLVGKGVVYDTGGLSLKPTPGSMDTMKCDMAGAAAVGAVMQAVAANQLPLHVVALVPATDNRPGGDAYAPGDVIRISDGTTVEVLNTDAEGRLILADALHYAKRFKPSLVLDLATLTGSAVMALGSQGTPCMGTADSTLMTSLLEAGMATYERLVPFPLWDEYGDMIRTPVADLKNIGGREAGAITAAKFLEHFTDYPWVHLDIAGPAFLDNESGYRGKHATGHGVRLLYAFLRARSASSKAPAKGRSTARRSVKTKST